MTKAKEYPLNLMLVITHYGKRTLMPIKARETKDFYFTIYNGVETKYKKISKVPESKKLNDSSWGNRNSYSSSSEDLYSLDASIIAQVKAENLLDDTKKAVNQKVHQLIKLSNYEKLAKVQNLLDELLADTLKKDVQ